MCVFAHDCSQVTYSAEHCSSEHNTLHADKYCGISIVSGEGWEMFTVVIIYFLQFLLTFNAVAEINGIVLHK